VKTLCKDLLGKYPDRDFTELSGGEQADLIAVVEREFAEEGWDAKKAKKGIQMVFAEGKGADVRKAISKARRQVSGNFQHT
jgi:hypothetical protein